MLYRLVSISVICLMFASCATFLTSGDRRLSEAERERDYELLFDGEDLTEHWVIMGNPEGWTVKDGVIHSDGGKGGEWLRSKKEYSDFILRLEWRVSPGGNSGVFFRCLEEGHPWVTGYEVQISNEQPPRDDSHCTGALYGLAAVDPRPDESPEVWRSFEIMCVHKRIIIKVDDQEVVDVDIDTIEAAREKPMEGYIGLQDSHTGEGKWVEFRNIRIREL